MSGTQFPASTTTTTTTTTSPPKLRPPPRATPPTQPLPPIPVRPLLSSSHSSPSRIPSGLSPSSRKDPTSSPRLGPSPLSPPIVISKPRKLGSRPDLRQAASALDTRTRSSSSSSSRGAQPIPVRTRGVSDAQYHRSRSSESTQSPPQVRGSSSAHKTPPRPPPSSFPGTTCSSPPRASSSSSSATALPSFHPFSAGDDDPTDVNMPPSDSRPSTPQGQSRFHTSHSGKLLLKLRAKASAHSLRSSPPTTESSSGWSPSPRTSEETLNELFFEEDGSKSSSMITAVIRQRVRTSSRESPVPSAPSKLRPSGEEKADKHDHDHDEEEDSATDFEDDFEGSMEDASFATVKAPPPPAAPAKFEVKDVVIRNGMRVAPHPVWEVPYPVGFSCAALQSDDKTHDLVKALLPDRNSPSFTHFKHAPGMVLDLGCGVGRWVVEAAHEWSKSRFVGLDLMDLQPDLSEKQHEEIRDRVQWVHSNFLQYKLPFPDAHFDFIRMSFIALAVPEQKWRFLVKELRRVLKPNGVLEWIDEEPVFPISPSYSPTSTPPQLLHNDFHSLLHARGLSNSIRVFPEELKALKGLFEMTRPKFERFKVCLPGPSTEMVSRAGYEGGLMRGLAGSPASISSSARAPVVSAKAGHHHAHSSSGSGSGLVRKGRELKRSLGGGSTSDAPAPAPAQEKVSFDGSAAGEKEKALPAIPLPHYVPQGLMVVAERTDERGQKFHENHLLPLTPEDVEVHAGRNSQVLLNSREAMWQTKSAGSGRSSSSAGGSSGREEFDGDLWRYECERWARLHLPVPTWYDSDEDGGHPSSSTTGGGAGSRIYGRRKAPRPLSMTVMMPPMGRKPTVARSIFVMTCKSL